MTVEQIEIRRILNQMLADNGINRETIKDIIKECIDERVEKAMMTLINQSDKEFEVLPDRIQKAMDKLLREEISNRARIAINEQVRAIFSRIVVNVSLNNPTESEGADDD